MATQIGENTKVIFDLKTILLIVGFTISLSTVWFTLKSDIAKAMILPRPVIERVEYDLKDELVRKTIINTQQDVERVLIKIDKLEERLYELSKTN